MTKDNQLNTFIVNSFRSVWALDLARFLLGNADRAFSESELIEALRASNAVVVQSVQSLLAAGLVSVDEQGRARFEGGDETQRTLVRKAIELYDSSPDRVRRLIVSRAAPGLTAFSDAFNLRRD